MFSLLFKRYAKYLHARKLELPIFPFFIRHLGMISFHNFCNFQKKLFLYCYFSYIDTSGWWLIYCVKSADAALVYFCALWKRSEQSVYDFAGYEIGDCTDLLMSDTPKLNTHRSTKDSLENGFKMTRCMPIAYQWGLFTRKRPKLLLHIVLELIWLAGERPIGRMAFCNVV